MLINNFYKIKVSFPHSLLNKKAFKPTENEILHRYFSRAMTKRFILQLYITTISLGAHDGFGSAIQVLPSHIGEYLNPLFGTICCSCFYFYFYFAICCSCFYFYFYFLIEQFFLIYCKFFCQKESFTYLLTLLFYKRFDHFSL